MKQLEEKQLLVDETQQSLDEANRKLAQANARERALADEVEALQEAAQGADVELTILRGANETLTAQVETLRAAVEKAKAKKHPIDKENAAHQPHVPRKKAPPAPSLRTQKHVAISLNTSAPLTPAVRQAASGTSLTPVGINLALGGFETPKECNRRKGPVSAFVLPGGEGSNVPPTPPPWSTPPPTPDTVHKAPGTENGKWRRYLVTGTTPLGAGKENRHLAL